MSSFKKSGKKMGFNFNSEKTNFNLPKLRRLVLPFTNLPCPPPWIAFYKQAFLLIWLWLSAISISAQVQFKVELLSDQITYQVSLLSSTTWAPPQNITSTAQVSIKVPTGGFEVNNVSTLIPGTFWANNAMYDAPDEDPSSDYFSFGLTSLGTSAITYEAGVELPLFQFVNAGICTGPVEIVANDDPFLPPNSLNANISNQITTLGGGQNVNVYSGPFDVGSANCQTEQACVIQYQLTQLAEGSYTVSMVADTAWNDPLNTTQELFVTLVAPTGSVNVDNLISFQNGANFELVNTYSQPLENPNSDYLVFQLIDNGTTSLNYQRGLVIPLFNFSNSGACSGSDMQIMDNENDPFSIPNSLDVMVGQFIQTTGSVSLINACGNGTAAFVEPQITNVNSSDLTDCGSNNGTITVETSGVASLEYSIDNGLNWQIAPFFQGLEPGEYHVAIRYLNGTCSYEYPQNPVVVETPTFPTINSIETGMPSGCGVNDGFILINATSVISPDYSIDAGQTWQTGQLFDNLPAGTYPIMIRNGTQTCPMSGDTVFLEYNDPTSPVIDSVSYTDITPCMEDDGTITIHHNNVQDFEFSIDNGNNWTTDAVFEDLPEGFYNVVGRNTQTNCISVYPNNPIQIITPQCDNCVAEYSLELLADGRLQISVIPYTTWNYPFNITSTAQVTIVAPTGSFEVMELTNLIPGVIFTNNSEVIAPDESPNEDYISFGLETLGTTDIPYQEGVKVPLFTFKNNGTCMGTDIRLMDNETDPFAFPNSQSINVGQQLSTVGSGQDGAVCIAYPGFAPCIPRVEAENDSINVFLNTSVQYNVLTNDTSFLNNPMSTSILPGSDVDHGTVTLGSDGTVFYIPDVDFIGVDTFQYVVCEDAHPGTCDIGLVVFNVSNANELLAVDDSYQTFINTEVTGNVLNNDENPDGNNLFTELANPPANGSVTIDENGDFNYMPNLGFLGIEIFSYKVCDDGFPTVCDFAEVQIEVQGSNALTAIDDNFIGMINTSISSDVLTNDFNPSGGPLNLSLVNGQGVSNGTLQLNMDGSFTYQPDADFTGFDSFQYAICEMANPSECDTATAYITIENNLLATNDTFNLEVNNSLFDNILDNDQIPNQANLILTLIDVPTDGDLMLFSDGSFNYNPDLGFLGTDSFTYQICDNGVSLICDTALVLINLYSNLIANDDQYNYPVNTPVFENVLDNDQLPTGVVPTIQIIDNPNNGNFNINPDGSFSYVPDLGFTGEDSFIYEICDTGVPQSCDTATVILDFTADLTAFDDDYDVPFNTSLNENVTINDLIPSGVNTIASVVDDVEEGTLILMPDGQIFYIPDNDFSGTDSFTYQICENSLNPVCDTATVSLNVLNFVEAIPDTFEVNINTTFDSTVIQNDLFGNFPVTFNLIETTNNGNLSFDSNGDFTYEPGFNFLGTDYFQYQICETAVPSNCDTALVTLEVKGLLIAMDDSESTESGEPLTGDVTSNDILPNNSMVTASVISGGEPENGTLSLNPDGTYTYIPTPGFIGIDEFDYVICNDDVPPICDTATVVLFVNPPELLAVNDTFYTEVNSILNGYVLANDLNPNGHTLTVNTNLVSGPSMGTVSMNSDGSFTYIPPFGASGNTTFEYEVCNDQMPQLCDVATVFINIINVVPATPVINCGGDICEGENIQLSILQNYTGFVLYEWLNGNDEIVGSSSVLSLSSDHPLAVPPYRVRVTQEGTDSEYSETCMVEATTKPEVNPSADYSMDSNCSPSALQLNANSNGSNLSYHWTGPNGFISQTENPSLPNVTENNNGSYVLTVSNEAGCSTTQTLQVNSILNYVPEPIINTTGPSCYGEEIQLTTQLYSGFDVDYVWMKDGAIMVGQSSNQLVLQPVDEQDEGMYQVMVMVDQCFTQSVEFEVNLLESPDAAPSFSLDAPCEGGNLSLELNATNPDDMAFFEWTGPNGFYSNAPNPTIQNADAGYNGTYTVILTHSNGCQLSKSIDISAINAIPEQPQVVSNSPICEEENIILTIQNPVSDPNIEYTWTNGEGNLIGFGENLIMAANQALAIPPFFVQASINDCDSDLSDPIAIELNNPQTPNLSINSDFLCEGETLILNSSLYSGQNIEYQWYFNNGTNTTTLGVSNTPTFFINSVSGSNEGQYFVIVTSNGCASDTSNLQVINVIGTSNPPAASNNTNSNAPACSGSNVQLELPLITGASYQWYGPAGFNSTLINPVIENVQIENAGEYFAVINFNGCNIVSSPTEVIITPEVEMPILSGEAIICEGNELELTVSNPNSNYTYEFFHFETGEKIDSTSNSETSITNFTEGQAGNYYVIASQNGCSSNPSEMIQVEIESIPDNIADAGWDQIICQNDPQINLNATAPSVGYGQWTSLNGENIINPNEANSLVADLSIGEHLFVWTLSTDACENYSMDTTSIILAEIPDELAYAGEDQEICGASSISLNGLIPNQSTGQWILSEPANLPGITFDDANSANTSVSGLNVGQTYTFTWSLSTDICENFSSDEVSINITEAPNQLAFIEEDELVVCDGSVAPLNANFPSIGYGTWSTDSQADIIDPNNPATGATFLDPGLNQFVWSLSSEGCLDYHSDTLFIYNESLEAQPDSFAVFDVDTTLVYDLLANDNLSNTQDWEVTILNQPQNGALIHLGDGLIQYTPYPSASGIDEFMYMLCSTNCEQVCEMASVTIMIIGTNEELFVPNTITPNGDGLNDAFVVPIVNQYPNSTCTIFNRRGDEIYYSSRYENDWQGTYNGKPLPTGTYFYCIRLGDGQGTILSGYVVVRHE